jgi:hypothetical protein
MIPSLNALKTGLQHILLDRVDVHTAISTLQIVDPKDLKTIEVLKGTEHDLWQVAEMLAQMIEEREEINKDMDNPKNVDRPPDMWDNTIGC